MISSIELPDRGVSGDTDSRSEAAKVDADNNELAEASKPPPYYNVYTSNESSRAVGLQDGPDDFDGVTY
ncbi:hypothetical protein VPNG_03314 [Cytospora leucostoma]|uniref:Uncharacterized protein n=1 Tax=Cytospora leucostoma TaxID=1230097 RepID=A0A423XG05_9PEZI|nr:hypothetical protein VPNG_03314 [Cytospora leucostoma]